MKFCIDESGLHYPLSVELQALQFSSFGNLISHCHEEGFTVERSDDLFEAVVSPGTALFEILYDSNSKIDPDIRNMVSLALNRCVIWSGFFHLSGNSNINISGNPHTSLSISRAHELGIAGEAIGLIQSGSDYRGIHQVSRNSTTCDLAFIHNIDGILPFYRIVPEIENMDANQYLNHTQFAFPTIYFVDGLASQTNHFSRPFKELRPIISHHLASLNDYFLTIFSSNSGDPVSIIGEFKATCSIDISPESSNTKSNKKAWGERRVELDGQYFYCDWHTKITWNLDRIHFYPGRANLQNGRLIVGIFHKHLTI